MSVFIQNHIGGSNIIKTRLLQYIKYNLCQTGQRKNNDIMPLKPKQRLYNLFSIYYCFIYINFFFNLNFDFF